jgi:putative membrane protein
MHYYRGPWNNGGFIGFHIFGFLIFVALIFVLVRFCFGGRFHHHHHIDTGSSDSSIEIVKQRYAKGEISKAEYDKLLKDLK